MHVWISSSPLTLYNLKHAQKPIYWIPKNISVGENLFLTCLENGTFAVPDGTEIPKCVRPDTCRSPFFPTHPRYTISNEEKVAYGHGEYLEVIDILKNIFLFSLDMQLFDFFLFYVLDEMQGSWPCRRHSWIRKRNIWSTMWKFERKSYFWNTASKSVAKMCSKNLCLISSKL